MIELTAPALIAALTVLFLSIFLGFELISKVPPTLHTPLMSGANAISGIAIVGALVAANAELAGGRATSAGTARLSGSGPGDHQRGRGLHGYESHAADVQEEGPMSVAVFDLGYLVAAACFIFGLKFLSSPKTAPRGNMIGAFGMLVAVLVTLLKMQADENAASAGD